MNDTGLMIAITCIKGKLPKEKSLTERIIYAMKYAQEHEKDVFWMFGSVNDDIKIRASLGAVMAEGTEDERALIIESLKPLQALSAAISGIPVDFGSMELSEDLLPIMKLWQDSQLEHRAKEMR